MIDIEHYMELFKESITNRLERHEDNFKDLVIKVKSFEVTQNEYKKRLRRLEDGKNQSDNEDTELQKVKPKSGKMFQIMEIEEKLKTLSSRVDNLENISSRHSIINNNDEQSNDVGNIQEQPAATEKGKWFKVKEKTIEYLKTTSVPGIPQIMNSNNFLLKLSWILLILLTFALGFWNIALAVTDYYHYDKITNVERVTPKKVIFPAITICTSNKNIKINNSIDWTNTRFILSEKDPFFNNTVLRIRQYFEYFKIPDNSECLRFNGITNKSLELVTANRTEDYLRLRLVGWTRIKLFQVFIADNYLNSFDKIEPYLLERNNRFEFDIRKEVEVKLPEPFNQCKKSFSIESYHQSNCIDTCLYREIRNKYNCSFLFTLYSFDGFRQCDNPIDFYKKEFNENCLKECPLESCYSEKYLPVIKPFDDDNNYTELRFSFYVFSMLNITQIPKTDQFTLINNVGGGLGLFMGIAFPNIIEFLQFITELFVITFS